MRIDRICHTNSESDLFLFMRNIFLINQKFLAKDKYLNCKNLVSLIYSCINPGAFVFIKATSFTYFIFLFHSRTGNMLILLSSVKFSKKIF